MTDCPNAEIRDRLPELLHERLDVATRAAVRAHVDACDACRAELALLRELRDGLVAGRRLDIASITRVVVSQTVVASRGLPQRAHRSWANWRVAAAITVIALGGTSLATVYATRRAATGRDSGLGANIALVDTALAGSGRANAVRAGRSSVARPEPAAAVSELSMGGGVSDLSESDLRALLDDIQGLDAVPLTEPEPVVVRLTPGSSE
jgi:anti-sigma factor RsiW